MKPRNLNKLAARLLDDLRIVRHALPDPRVPWTVKLLLFLTACYLFSPIDLIPDFIPVLGLLDEAILIPLAIRLAVSLIPPEVRADLERRAAAESRVSRNITMTGLVLVLVLWTALLGAVVLLARRL
jgi:uncharacterized membrane protein YkvA (DUF1232 family)